MASSIRPYDRDLDNDAVNHMWREISWVESSDDPDILGRFLDAGRAEVGVLDGTAEALAHWTPGTIRYQDTDLPLGAITAVTTSLIARKQRFATTLTARALASIAAEGAAVAALGIFDQGFYDRLGFGTSGYGHLVNFDPAALLVDHVPYRQPVRLSIEDHREVHELMARRHRPHGSLVLDPPDITRSELQWIREPFGLGYREGDRLTHALFGQASGENGPHRIKMVAYEQPGQLLELLRLLRELGDQVTTVRMLEPAEIQFQDLLATPFRDGVRTTSSPHTTGIEAKAWWQFRVVDLVAVVAARHWSGPDVRFNLTLTDPVADLAGIDWPGIGGDYVVTVGSASTVEPGHDGDAPRLTATVNAFSRMWFGVRPASSLPLTNQLNGPPALLHALDEALRLPPPRPGLSF